MIFYQTLEPEDVLESLAYLFVQTLPDEVQKGKYTLNFEFQDDHSVDIYLVPKETSEQN